MSLAARLARTALLLGLLVGWLVLAAARGRYFDPPRAGREDVDPRTILVLDGDTLLHEGRVLRLLAVDAPERGAPWFSGDQEPWASRARALVEEALRAARRATILRSGREDARGRALVHLLVDDEPVAVMLVQAGLAVETVSAFGDAGFPEIARRVVQARRPVPFEDPWAWRRAHRIEPP